MRALLRGKQLKEEKLISENPTRILKVVQERDKNEVEPIDVKSKSTKVLEKPKQTFA